MTPELPPEYRKILLGIARESIVSALEDRPPAWPALPSPSISGGAFVTLHRRGALRGCIGRMQSDRPLADTVREMARAAAFEDPRFGPLVAEELPDIAIEITILSPMRPLGSPGEIELGRHGLHISAGWRAGVLLPQVATEYGWDRKTFLEQTCRKAGLPPDAWKKEETVVMLFEGTVFGE